MRAWCIFRWQTWNGVRTSCRRLSARCGWSPTRRRRTTRWAGCTRGAGAHGLCPAPPPDADPTARYRLWEPNEWLVEVVAASDLTPCVSLEGEPQGAPPCAPTPLSHIVGEGLGVRANRRTASARDEQKGYTFIPRAIDLGCGSGREAVYLAAQGWQVVAVDRLPEALQRGRDLQRRYAPDSPPIQWVCADLERSDWQPDG
jgi:SAM-dependent methyltransferase